MPFIDFYFDFISPYSYLAATQLPAFEQRNAVDIDWIPVDLPSLLDRAGNISPATIPKKALYLLRDLKRWGNHLDVPLKMIKPGAFDSRPALNIASALEPAQRKRFSQETFASIWSGEIDVKEPDWLQRLFAIRRFPPDWLTLAASETGELLENQTSRALKTGAFGAPTFVLHGKGKPQMFWGVDRMDFLERAIGEARVSPDR